jgi:hypothetical protein
MLRGKRLCVVFVCFLMLFLLALPAFAGDPQTTAKDLKGISAKRHKYIFSTLGGAAIGAGIGVLLGSGNDITKGLMIGGGGASALYLHTHQRDTLNGWRHWVFIGSYTSFGSGMGWTLCGCDDGAVAGALIGGGTSAWYQATHPTKRTTTATTQP